MDTNAKITLCAVGNIYGHQSPFINLPILVNSQESNQEFYEKWVIPFYMQQISETAFQSSYQAVRKDCEIEIVIQLLGEMNWRTRIVGAYFAAIEQFTVLEEAIGNLLLRSDLCFAGNGYCVALAAFNTSRSLIFLQDYLSYYLKQKELWFNQATAMAAIAYLDQINGTNNLASHNADWQEFVKDKPNWDLQRNVDGFTQTMKSISLLRTTNNFQITTYD